MDFVSDALFDGRRFRALTIIDQFIRECLAIHADQSIRGEQVVAILKQLSARHGVPKRVQTNNRGEFIALHPLEATKRSVDFGVEVAVRGVVMANK